MRITKEKIVVSNKTYDIDEIKCADFEKSETSVRAITIPLIVIVSMVLYFHTNFILFFMLFFLIIATIPTRTIYTITLNNDIFDDYKTYNKKEFEQKKEKINKIIDKNLNKNSSQSHMDKFKIN